MSLDSAMNSGISGLQSFSSSMGVIGNNLANTNTPGFKASRTLFSDMIPDTITGSGGASQIGRGSNLSTVDDVFTQGSIESTTSNLDLAIEGEGFFLVRDPDSATSNFTRAGTFRLDSDGYLINPEGNIVQGYARTSEDNFAALTGDIQVNTRSSVPGEASSRVQLTTNLNSDISVSMVPEDPDDPEGDQVIRSFDIDDAERTSDFATTSEIYDSLGRTHQVTTYFRKTGMNEWMYHHVIPKSDLDMEHDEEEFVQEGEELVEVGRGTLGFDTSGILQSIEPEHGVLVERPEDDDDPDWNRVETIREGNLPWNNGSDTDNALDYRMDVTQFSTESRVETQQSDGYSSGYLTDITVDQEGTITGTYSNGESRPLARLALGKFANDNGLKKLGNNLYAATAESGPADIGTPGSGFGSIFSNSLEQSTVDIAAEFTRMITTQRSFQANSKTITSTDEMLSEVINMKR